AGQTHSPTGSFEQIRQFQRRACQHLTVGYHDIHFDDMLREGPFHVMIFTVYIAAYGAPYRDKLGPRCYRQEPTRRNGNLQYPVQGDPTLAFKYTRAPVE